MFNWFEMTLGECRHYKDINPTSNTPVDDPRSPPGSSERMYPLRVLSPSRPHVRLFRTPCPRNTEPTVERQGQGSNCVDVGFDP